MAELFSAQKKKKSTNKLCWHTHIFYESSRHDFLIGPAHERQKLDQFASCMFYVIRLKMVPPLFASSIPIRVFSPLAKYQFSSPSLRVVWCFSVKSRLNFCFECRGLSILSIFVCCFFV